MDISLVYDFYYLNAAEYRMWTIKPRDDAENLDVRYWSLRRAVEGHLEKVIDVMADTFVAYAFMAAFGEARHAYDKASGEAPCDLPSGGRGSAYDSAIEYDLFASAPALIRVFDQNWESGYGGNAWKSISKAISLYKVNKTVFVDHIIDLKHNGGSLFDKDGVLERVHLNMDIGENTLMNFLDLKKNYDLLSNGIDDEKYYAHVSVDVRKLLENFGKRNGGHITFYHHRPDLCKKLSETCDLGMFGTDVLGSQGWEEISQESQCESCGSSYPSEDMYHTEGGDILCSDCYNEDYASCDHCGTELYKEDAKVTSGGDYICDRCAARYSYIQCENCGYWSTDSKEYKGDEYCQDCWEFTCDQCCDIHEADELIENEDGDWICSSCNDKNNEEGAGDEPASSTTEEEVNNE